MVLGLQFIYLEYFHMKRRNPCLSSHMKDICIQILSCECDWEGEERELKFDVILILYASLSNYYKANYLLQLLD